MHLPSVRRRLGGWRAEQLSWLLLSGGRCSGGGGGHDTKENEIDR